MRRMIIAGFLTLFFIINLVLVLTHTAGWLDVNMYNLITYFQNDILTDIFLVFSFLGSTVFIVSLNVIIFLYFMIKKQYRYTLFVTNSLISVIFNNIVKLLVQRPRPDNSLWLITESGYSFPSGHTMISVLFYGTIIYFLHRYRPKHFVLYTVLLIFLMVGIGVSRIYLGVHYASDVFGGYFLASILICVTITIFQEIIFKEWLL